jgi:hypothetical protein
MEKSKIFHLYIDGKFIDSVVVPNNKGIAYAFARFKSRNKDKHFDYLNIERPYHVIKPIKTHEEVKAQKREYYKRNKEKILASHKKYKDKNKEKVKEYHRNYMREYMRHYKKKIA